MTCAFTTVMPTGARIDMLAPDPKRIWLCDVADTLARLPADPHISAGFYSLAQRGQMIASVAAREDGPLSGLHALLFYAPFAVIRVLPSEDPHAWPQSHAKILAAVHAALDLDPPQRVTFVWLGTLQQRMRLAELRCLRRGVDAEIAELHGRGVTQPLVGRIAPLGWDAARDRYLETFKAFAIAATLTRTPAWSGIH